MYRVFPALEAKFGSNRRLVQLARKLYHGLNGQRVKGVREYVEVTGGQTGDYDTFGTDEPVYSLAFLIHGGSSADKVGLIMEELERTFEDCNLDSGHFATCSMQLEGSRGPELLDGVFEGSMDFMLHICRRVNLPAVRMA